MLNTLHDSRDAARLRTQKGTLVWVLFADAAQVLVRDLRADLGLYARLPAVGLPLTIGVGAPLTVRLFDGIGAWRPCWSARRWRPPTRHSALP